MAVIRTGGQQFLVQQDEEIIVQKLESDVNKTVELETLGIIENGKEVAIGTPLLDTKVKATVLAHMKGDKVRIAKFKAKVRYRKVQGFRPELTKIKITAI